jgi:hypothetical protein
MIIPRTLTKRRFWLIITAIIIALSTLFSSSAGALTYPVPVAITEKLWDTGVNAPDVPATVTCDNYVGVYRDSSTYDAYQFFLYYTDNCVPLTINAFGSTESYEVGATTGTFTSIQRVYIKQTVSTGVWDDPVYATLTPTTLSLSSYSGYNLGNVGLYGDHTGITSPGYLAAASGDITWNNITTPTEFDTTPPIVVNTLDTFGVNGSAIYNLLSQDSRYDPDLTSFMIFKRAWTGPPFTGNIAMVVDWDSSDGHQVKLTYDTEQGTYALQAPTRDEWNFYGLDLDWNIILTWDDTTSDAMTFTDLTQIGMASNVEYRLVGDDGTDQYQFYVDNGLTVGTQFDLLSLDPLVYTPQMHLVGSGSHVDATYFTDTYEPSNFKLRWLVTTGTIDGLVQFYEQCLLPDQTFSFDVQDFGEQSIRLAYTDSDCNVLQSDSMHIYNETSQQLNIDGSEFDFRTTDASVTCSIDGEYNSCLPPDENNYEDCDVLDIPCHIRNSLRYFGLYSITAPSSTADIFESFTSDNYGLTAVAEAPFTVLNQLTTGDYACIPITVPLPSVSNKSITLPCFASIYSNYLGAFYTMYSTVVTGFISYYALVRILQTTKEAKDPETDRLVVFDL